VKRVAKDALIAEIRAARARFDEIVARVPRERLTEPILPGGWSVKDVLAHVAWGEREGIGVVRARALVGSELWELSEDERNAAVVNASRDRGLEQVLREYRDAFSEYIAAITTLTNEDLNEPGRFEGLAARIPGWPPWRVVYDPGHYLEHGRTISQAFGFGPSDREDADE
jgi:uncharacterized protein (TIGR03083 family)